MVLVQSVDDSIVVDLRYKTEDNFMRERLYPENAQCFLVTEVAQSLVKAQQKFKDLGYGLIIFDAYRPLSVQKKMWAKFPQEGYVANPAKGSNHNRGCAVDVSLLDAQGNLIAMPSDYDEFSERAHWDYQDADLQRMEHKQLLRKVMQECGFKGISTEWWHFDHQNSKQYPVLDVDFSQVATIS